MRSSIKELKIEDKVQMMGMCSHAVVEEELEKASIYVMTSYSEAFPFVSCVPQFSSISIHFSMTLLSDSIRAL